MLFFFAKFIEVGCFEFGDSTYRDFYIKIKALFGFLGLYLFSTLFVEF